MIWALPRLAGLFFDALVGQTVHALGRPWSAPRAGSPQVRTALSAVQPVIPVPQDGPPQDRAPWDRDLQDDAVQLVSYTIVSLRPGLERVLPGGAGQILVTCPMSGETFVAWIVARYFQTAGVKIEHEEKRYLRVAYEVLHRWPAESHSGCHESRVRVLKDIRDAIVDLPRRPERATARPATPAPAARPATPAPAARPATPAPALPAEAPLPPPPPAPSAGRKRDRKKTAPTAGGEKPPEAPPPGGTKKRKPK